jgi:outer membrane receptor protein involved in Fe transport
MSNKIIIRSLAGILAASMFLPVFAQYDQVIETVVVVAQKREQTLQEVPVAVSVVSVELIEEAQIIDITDLQTVVPSLRVSTLQTSGNTDFRIRGFGNGANNPGIEPSVGVFIDGVYRSRSAAFISDLPNIERIEVLRGPQSTLFGKNASAGVINVITRAPNMEEFGGSASLTYGNYNQIIAKADIEGPVSETLGFSLGAYGNKRDGYFKNLESGSDINERDRWGVRAQMLWEPNDKATLRIIADYDQIDEKCCGVANLLAGPTTPIIFAIGGKLVPNAPFARENYLDFDPTNLIKNKGISAQLDYHFDNDMLFTSITAYRELSRLENADVDFTSARLVGINNGDTQIDTFTQEFRLSQSLEAVDWMVGVYYFDESLSHDNITTYDVAMRPYIDISSQGGVTTLEQTLKALGQLPPSINFFDVGQGTFDKTGQDDKTTSVFGQVDWHVTDRLTLTGGANYTKVKKDAFVNQVNTDFFAALDMVQVGFGAIFANLTGLPPTPDFIAQNPGAAAVAGALAVVPCSDETGPACNQLLGLQQLQFLGPFVNYPNSVENGKSSDSKTTWMARVAFDATDNINLYASAGTGFKATSWNLSRDSRPFESDIGAIYAAGLAVPNLEAGTRYAGPEEALVYELGFKSRWQSVILNMAIFYQEITGFQSNIFTGTGFELLNAGKQSTEGIELDTVWFPTDDFKLTFAATWLDPVYDEFVEAQGVDGPEDLSGTTPPGIHTLSISTSATYYFDMGSTQGFIRGEYVYDDNVPVVENVPASVASREISMFNASIGIKWGDGWEAMLWGRNLNNDDFLISAFPGVAQPGTYSGYPNQPRTYGITVRTRF